MRQTLGNISHSFRVLVTLAALSVATSALQGQPWTEQGPGPITGGQSEGIPNRPVSGAVNAIVIAPGDGNTVYVATVNGGVWKTTNALAASPTWTPLTDQALPAQSIGALALSPLDANTIFAGTGSTSSDGFDGSAGFGVAKSTDAGATWSVLGATTFTNRRINSIVPTATISGGQVVLASTLFDRGGVYRSTDGGVTWTRLSGDGVSGLPDGGVSKIVGDPGVPGRFYAGVPANFLNSGTPGVYKTEDSGASWTAVNNPNLNVASSDRILFSVHHSAAADVVYAMVIVVSSGSDVLGGVFRSPDQGATWTQMGTPNPNIFPGGQGQVHGAIAAHPTDPNVVFMSGDRQNSPFPNVNGCHNFSANIFRGDASQAPASQWASVVCNGAQGTSPHADSRSLVFDQFGNLLNSNDGGLAKLLSPDNAATRIWTDFNGDIRPTEFHSIAFDHLSHITFGGAQDTGTSMQNAPANKTWSEFIQADGGNVAVDDNTAAHPGQSIRYTCAQFLGSFNRSFWDSANNFVTFNFLGLHITSGPGTGQTLFQADPNIQFYNPYALNQINPDRMLIGTANIYESFDRGDSLANLGFTGQFITSLSYGGRFNNTAFPDVFYVGTQSNSGAPTPQILHRVVVGGPITVLSSYPGTSVRVVVMDPQNYKNVYVLDNISRVWASTDEGVTWVNLTANLHPQLGSTRAMEIFSPGPTPLNTVLVVGGLGGVAQMRRPGAGGASWVPIGTGLPRALILDLHYDYACDVLTAGILGRGAWTISGAFRGASTAGCPSLGTITTTQIPSLPVEPAPPVVVPNNQ